MVTTPSSGFVGRRVGTWSVPPKLGMHHKGFPKRSLPSKGTTPRPFSPLWAVPKKGILPKWASYPPSQVPFKQRNTCHPLGKPTLGATQNLDQAPPFWASTSWASARSWPRCPASAPPRRSPRLQTQGFASFPTGADCRGRGGQEVGPGKPQGELRDHISREAKGGPLF